MTTEPIKVFQFPRMFAIPNLSPFCCKLETWLRIAGILYQTVDTGDPRKGPHGKLPFIEDGGARIADTSVIIRHLKETRGVDPDAHLDASQRATHDGCRTQQRHRRFLRRRAERAGLADLGLHGAAGACCHGVLGCGCSCSCQQLP